MSCICQYFVPLKNESCVSELKESESKDQQDDVKNDSNSCSTAASSESAADLANIHAEMWLIKKSMTEACMTIENLETLVKTLIDKQSEMLTEIYHLKKKNNELQDECRMQRDYHCMERNAMMRELHDIKIVLGRRSRDLEEAIAKNTNLLSTLEDANHQIYSIGLKYYKLKQIMQGHIPKNIEADNSAADNSEASTIETDDTDGESE